MSGLDRPRGSSAAVVPTFCVGVVLGFLTAFATFSGRIATVETTTATHTTALATLGQKVDNLTDAVDALREQVAAFKRP